MIYIIIIIIIILFSILLINNYNNQEHFENNKFKNVILLVVFNFANCVHNMNNIKLLYQKHFKDIIFYSDIPEDNKTEINLEVNYLPITRGYYTHKIFKHFYNKYKDLITNSDGLMYTMDDNIINVKELDNYSTDKIICYYEKELYYNMTDEINKATKEWVHWNPPKMTELLNDSENKIFNVERFTWGYSDWFYIPKKNLDDKLFDLFEFFGKKEIFLEIAIPTVIRYFHENEDDYQTVKYLCLWGDRHKFDDKEFVYKSLKEDKNLIIHPIKFNSNPNALIWLYDIFNN